MSEEFQNWACMELDKLGLPDAGIIIQYLEPLEKPSEVKEYLQSMLDMSQSSHRDFVKEFLEKQAESKVDKRFYRKKNDAEEPFVARPQGKKKGGRGKLTRGESGSSSTSNEREQKSKNGSNNSSNRSTPPSDVNSEPKSSCNSDNDRRISPDPPSTSAPKTQGKKKENKFVNLYTADNVELLSGRNMCECLASKHELINNCLSCGRIVCKQEGAGPCFFCGNDVKPKPSLEPNVDTSESQDNASIKKNGKGKQGKDEFDSAKKAVAHKNKLLEFDRTSEKRTKVLDDECDYFESGSRWLSKEDREILQAREKEWKEKKYDRNNKKITIDLLGRQVVTEENTAEIFDPEDPVVKAILDKQVNDLFTDRERNNLPPPSSLLRPVYVGSDEGRVGESCLAMSSPTDIANRLNRLQDKELQEMSDQGKCLSMHQPWASLLIAGIKMHEGRTWYSAHRGRLWIAAAAKVPSQREIEDLQNFYLQRGEKVNFPKHYPSGVLLGCVDVVDVLPQEEYRVQYPDGESESPFVFVCQTPKEMIYKFPIKGQHKIFDLESKFHQAARKALKSEVRLQG